MFYTPLLSHFGQCLKTSVPASTVFTFRRLSMRVRAHSVPVDLCRAEILILSQFIKKVADVCVPSTLK